MTKGESNGSILTVPIFRSLNGSVKSLVPGNFTPTTTPLRGLRGRTFYRRIRYIRTICIWSRISGRARRWRTDIRMYVKMQIGRLTKKKNNKRYSKPLERHCRGGLGTNIITIIPRKGQLSLPSRIERSPGLIASTTIIISFVIRDERKSSRPPPLPVARQQSRRTPRPTIIIRN